MENNNSSKLIIGLIALVVVVGGIFLAVNMNDDSTNNETSSSQTEQTQTTQTEQVKTKDIVGLASETQSLSTLVSAVKAADLVTTLQGAGPFTVLAPSNDAFAALPAGTLDTLLMPENKEQLKSILTYHVIAGKVMAADLKDGQEVSTVQGGKLTVKIADGKVYFVDAKGGQSMVSAADVMASNGVVHIINTVLMPN
jgi:uncharacterized surface protein with fasciclin (FAS1) repeats